MKKSIIALAVAGALTAPIVAQADATLYGKLAIAAKVGDGQELDLYDYMPSRVGIKGSVDTSIDGVKAIYQAEWAVATTDGQGAAALTKRLGYVGLTGGFGTVAFGAQWSPYFSVVNGMGADLAETSTGISKYVRLDNVAAYVTPEMGGFKVAAALVADAGTLAADTTKGLSAYNVAVSYSGNGLSTGVTVLGIDNAANTTDWGAGAQYNMDALTVGVGYQDLESDNVQQWELGASYAVTDATSLTLVYADLDNNEDQTTVEVKQMLGKQTRVFAQYVNTDDGVDDTGIVKAGMRVDF